MKNEMSPAFKLLRFISARGVGDDHAAVIKGLFVTATEDCPNDYDEDYKTIAAGTVVQCDFGGDFGFYGFADDNGKLRRTRVNLKDIHRFDWSPHQEAIDSLTERVPA